MVLNRLFGGVVSVVLLLGCTDSVAPNPEGPRFSYSVSGYGKATGYSGARAGFTLVSDPCVAGASMLRIDLTTSEGMRTTFALRLGEAGAPSAGVYPFSIARLPGVADVFYSDVREIGAWFGKLVFLRLTGELRLIEVADSRISGSFDFEAVSSWFGPEPVHLKGTFDAAADPDPAPVSLECEPSAPPSWPHEIRAAIVSSSTLANSPVEVDVLGRLAVIGISTAGSPNCDRPAEPEVVMEGRTATVIPRFYVALPGAGFGCLRALTFRVAPAVVSFDQSGPAIIRVRGLSENSGAMITVERPITIP